MKSHTILLYLTWDMNYVFVQDIPPFSHLVAIWLSDSYGVPVLMFK